MIKIYRSPNVVKEIPPLISFLYYPGSTCPKLDLKFHFIFSIFLFILSYTVLFHSSILYFFAFLTCILISPSFLRISLYHPFSMSNLSCSSWTFLHNCQSFAFRMLWNKIIFLFVRRNFIIPKPNPLNNPQYGVDFDMRYNDCSIYACVTSTFHTRTHTPLKFFKIAEIIMLKCQENITQ